MNSRNKAKSKIPSLPQYIRVDDEVEILVDTPVSVKMEVDLSPELDDSTLSSVNDLDYADSFPDERLRRLQNLCSPSLFVPRTRIGKKKNGLLLKSSMGNKLGLPPKAANGDGMDSNCDNLRACTFNISNNVDPNSLVLKKGLLPPVRKQWTRFGSLCSGPMVEDLSCSNACINFSENGPSVCAEDMVSMNHSGHYGSLNPILVTNEADIPPFTPNLDIRCHAVSNMLSCSRQEVICTKTSQATKSRVSIMKRKVKAAAKNRVVQKTCEITSLRSQKKKRPAREMNALYENLKEISWAQDKEFTSLLASNDSHRHIPRTSAAKFVPGTYNAKAIEATKSSPRTADIQPKASPVEKAKVKKSVAQKPEVTAKTKNVSLSTMKPKPKNALSTFVQKKLKKSANIALQKNSKLCLNSLNKKTKPSVIRYQLGPALMKSVSASIKEKAKTNKLAMAMKEKSISSKGKISEKSDAKKEAKMSKTIAKSDVDCEQIEFWDGQSFKGSDVDLMALLNKRQELRVTLDPMECTNLLQKDCDLLEKPVDVEAYTRKSLQQSMLKVFTGVDQKHISSVLRESPDSKPVVATNGKTSRKRKYDEESVRSSVRQSECAFRYKEIVVKKHENYIQIVLVPNSLKQNALTIEAMKELKEAFLSARKDPNCKAVLLNSSGSYFCSGIDLSQLQGQNKKHLAEEMAITIRDLILTLAIFPKPVVAAVNGYAIGLGVTLLTFCDVVLCSDKATFWIPATKFGYIPEGGALLTLPQVVGSTVAMEMLLQGKRLTAEQALKYGLVSEVLWPTQLMEEVVPRMLALVQQPLHVMEATKTMVRCHLWEKLGVQLSNEWRILPSNWLSTYCQQNIKQHLLTGWLQD